MCKIDSLNFVFIFQQLYHSSFLLQPLYHFPFGGFPLFSTKACNSIQKLTSSLVLNPKSFFVWITMHPWLEIKGWEDSCALWRWTCTQTSGNRPWNLSSKMFCVYDTQYIPVDVVEGLNILVREQWKVGVSLERFQLYGGVDFGN